MKEDPGEVRVQELLQALGEFLRYVSTADGKFDTRSSPRRCKRYATLAGIGARRALLPLGKRRYGRSSASETRAAT